MTQRNDLPSADEVRGILKGYTDLAGQHEALTQLAEWLICMDDIEDAYGSAERRTVTLTKIIDRAKLALRGEVPA